MKKSQLIELITEKVHDSIANAFLGTTCSCLGCGEVPINGVLSESKPSFDLAGNFYYLNKQLFGGKLPQVKLKWASNKTRFGVFKSKLNRSTDRNLAGEVILESCVIELTDLFKQTEFEYLSTLAHEMIHLKLALERSLSNARNPHGALFLMEARRVNATGLVEVTERSPSADFAPHVKVKPAYVMVLGMPGRPSMVGVFQKYDIPGEYMRFAIRDIEKYQFRIYKSEDVQLKKFTVSRTNANPSLFLVKDDKHIPKPIEGMKDVYFRAPSK